MITALMVALMVISDAASDVFIALAMKQNGPVRIAGLRSLVTTVRRVLGSGTYALGIASAALHFTAFLLLLSCADLSFVVPCSALVYVAGTLGARLFLGETVPPRRWAGVLLVCAGVALASID